MKTIFLLRGAPGSGKSFTANLLSENGKYPVLSADMYFEDSDGNYIWDGSKIKEAHEWCKHQLEGLMSGVFRIEFPDKNRKSEYYNREVQGKIFIANTFTQEWEMEDYYVMARKYGYDVVSMIVENRHNGKNIHGVSDETLVKMQERFQIKL